MEYLIATIIGLATGIAVMVIAEKAPRLSRWFIRRGARLYVEPKASRFEEEWLAHLATRDGPYSMIWHGLGCFSTGLRRGDYFKRMVNAKVGALIVRSIIVLYFFLDKVRDHLGHRQSTLKGEFRRFLSFIKNPKAVVLMALVSIPVISITILVISLVPLTTSRAEEVEITREAARRMRESITSLFAKVQ